LLALFLFGGVGIVLYVASGERDGHRDNPGIQAGSDAGSAGALLEPVTPGSGSAAVLVPENGAGVGSARTIDVGDAAKAGSGKADVGKSDAAKPDAVKIDKAGMGSGSKPDRSDKAQVSTKPGKKASSETEARQILKAAEKLRESGKFQAAFDEYGRVAASQHMPGRGLLGQARVAFEQQGFEKAAQLAQAAAKKGADSVSASLLRAAALQRLGRAQEAVGIYQYLQKRATGKALVQVKRELEILRADCKSCKFN
jgi:hypothetical protein